ncbi:tRNA uridine-5-carboxymethylaminomethyl(34) synthesis GTPase MnmE [Proteocatella sphenisci]|uniref:tRNA uridine-5-carboxymethylaminomethyl(34) synthesis GTPase MnmE n=1 Tax=Proteocatella sphenisci TaxID=181070 RepID=UPI00048F67C8|nr:tRNA uridine-5-carboxymethylaminomethyl(34) synthesis GTPase MnmE [Proteocatella sphenisci]
MYIDDTIAAIVTAPGEAGVGIIRVSGKDALECVNRIFEPAREGTKLEDKVRYMVLGHIVEKTGDLDRHTVDEVLCVYMKAPHTYTREDVVEINCHGGYLSLRKTLELVLKNGARLAERGEYTKRAFLSGRIDLSQAEAVMDIITAKTGKSHELSQKQLEGKLSGKLADIRHAVTADLARITVAVDFPEEDEPDVTYAELIESTTKHLLDIKKMVNSFEAGKIYRDGLRTVIIGKPNVGKSSLLNGILMENRAIVTEIAGTTRDIIEEYLTLDGIPIRLVDTAGIRSTEDVVEKIGVERSKESIEEADLVILMLDRSRELDSEDLDIIDISKDKKLIVIINKQDLESRMDEEIVRKHIDTDHIIHASVINNQGIDELKTMIKHMVEGEGLSTDNDYMINNVRHKNALERAAKACEDALESLAVELPLDIIETDFKNIWDYLGEITGDTTSETLLDNIFANFCIGK